ncbi:M48 family metallopeptidase [Candidatus Parcubacteria bacterium]|nr:M48 family metallopeptidase [Candidatus Parcubacteria bacterium]
MPFDTNNLSFKERQSSRAKYLSVSVYRDGRVEVSIPKNASRDRIDRFLESKSSWIKRKLEYFKKFQGKILLYHDAKLYKTNKEKAFKLVHERLGHFNKHYNFSWNKIVIKNQSTRWGSCSLKGNLNFNYNIVFLPPDVSDYIIVHELCHLKEFNHGPNFWKLVAETIPNYKELRSKIFIS